MYKKINVRKFLAYVSVRTNQFFVRPSEFRPTYRTTFAPFFYFFLF
jgi:hypothetical protein